MKINKMKTMGAALLILGVQTAQAAGTNSIETGAGVYAPGTNSTAYGDGVTCGAASSSHLHCYGQDIHVDTSYGVFVGSNIRGTGFKMGYNLNGDSSTSIGSFHQTANGVNAIGNSVRANENSTVMGDSSNVGMYSQSYGNNSTVGDFSQNLGFANNVGDYAQALGTSYSTVTYSNTVVGGMGVNTTGATNTVVLGGNFVSNLRSNEVYVANRTLGGVSAATQADQATNLAQVEAADEATYQRAVTYTDNALASFNASEYSGEISALQNDVGGLRDEVKGLSKKVDAIHAVTAAQSNILYNPYGSQYQIGVGAGYSGGSSALAVKMMGSNRNRSVMYSAGASFANGSKGSVGAGMSFNF